MRNLIRENELQKLYDRLIAREHLLLLGKVGSGKSYLLDRLKERLEGRRTIFIIDCRQLVSFQQFARVLPAAVKNEAQSNPNLLYQFQRFEDEHPLQELRDWQDLEAYIKDLGVFLTQAGGDYLSYLKNWEEWELEWSQVEFLSVLEDLAQA